MKIVVYLKDGKVSGVFADSPEEVELVVFDRDEAAFAGEGYVPLKELVTEFDEEAENDFGAAREAEDE